ncbi:hypothetical protein LBMAG53_39290 [Planctomycetota bacterium]|nr:hypothetical protein LBMAG53_39290 [Planctomycetota bacterium]
MFPLRAPALIPLLALAGLPALETPLIIPGEDDGEVAIVHPGLGTLTLYQVQDQLLTRKGSVNFKAELGFLGSFIFTERLGVPWTMLRSGATNTKPEVLGLLEGKPTAEERREGLKSLRERAVECEDAFWAAERPYDGVVRAAFGRQYLMLAVQASHSLVMYETVGEGWKLASFRNYGPELLIPLALNSEPSPKELRDNLVDKATNEEQKKIFEHAFDGIGALPGGPTPASVAWLGVAPNESFVLVDSANTRICLYQMTGKDLKLQSVRNYSVEMKIPGLIGEGIHDEPGQRDLLAAYQRDANRMKRAKDYGIAIDRENIIALVGQQQSGKLSPLEVAVQGERLIIDLQSQRLLMTYDLRGGDTITLISVRDYTIDVGLALLDQKFRDMANATKARDSARQLASAKSYKSALLMIRLALKLDPMLVKEIEADAAFRDLKKQADWLPIIDEAHKEVERLVAQAKERKKVVEDLKRKGKDEPEPAGGNEDTAVGR